MTDHTPAAISNIEDASTARWLTQTLAPARARIQAGPSEEALDRIRARVFGNAPKKVRSIAA